MILTWFIWILCCLNIIRWLNEWPENNDQSKFTSHGSLTLTLNIQYSLFHCSWDHSHFIWTFKFLFSPMGTLDWKQLTNHKSWNRWFEHSYLARVLSVTEWQRMVSSGASWKIRWSFFSFRYMVFSRFLKPISQKITLLTLVRFSIKAFYRHHLKWKANLISKLK